MHDGSGFAKLFEGGEIATRRRNGLLPLEPGCSQRRLTSPLVAALNPATRWTQVADRPSRPASQAGIAEHPQAKRRGLLRGYGCRHSSAVRPRCSNRVILSVS